MSKIITKIIDDLVVDELQQFAAEVEEEANTHLAAANVGHLTPQTEVIKTSEGRGLVFLIPGYKIFVEYGVQGTENTPEGAADSPFAFKHLGLSRDMVSSLKRWAGREGITPKTKTSPLENTNTRKSLKESSIDPATSMAFAIGKSVKKKGISAKKVYEKTLTPERMQTLADKISTAIGKEAAVALGSV